MSEQVLTITAKSILGIWKVDDVKLASVRTIVLCSSSNICIFGGRDYSGKHILKGDDVFLKEHAKFTKEFIKEFVKELLKYACLWQLSNGGYRGVG